MHPGLLAPDTTPKLTMPSPRFSNQTNLAIKGIIALEAMGRIAKLTGNSTESTRYSNIASDYLEFWKQHGIKRAPGMPHTMLQYDQPDTYGTATPLSLGHDGAVDMTRGGR